MIFRLFWAILDQALAVTPFWSSFGPVLGQNRKAGPTLGEGEVGTGKLFFGKSFLKHVYYVSGKRYIHFFPERVRSDPPKGGPEAVTPP